MTYRTLGRTGFSGSRLVFGCGAALMFRRRDELLETALAHGVNVFDVGTRDYYRSAEQHLADFARKHRDRIFLISKGLVGLEIEPGDELSAAQRRERGRELVARARPEPRRSRHRSRRRLLRDGREQRVAGAQRGDARGVPGCAEGGQGRPLGPVSTHQNAQAVLDAAAETGWYSLAQIAVTPAGWYDWTAKDVLPDSRPMAALRPTFDRARAAGIGLIGMKAGRHLAGRWYGLGPDRPTRSTRTTTPRSAARRSRPSSAATPSCSRTASMP